MGGGPAHLYHVEILFWAVQVMTTRGSCDAHLKFFWLKLDMAMLASLLQDQTPLLTFFYTCRRREVFIYTAEKRVPARRLHAIARRLLDYGSMPLYLISFTTSCFVCSHKMDASVSCRILHLPGK